MLSFDLSHFQGSYIPPSPAKDATEAFEDVGHSDEARALLKDMLVGEFEKGGVRLILQTLLTNFADFFYRS